uniref:Transmembrane protein n=1 Tax=Timema genevievae TaxID=629358 RepID=A0A7R9PM85_TIMGE|nr:unnamed protein product [Timema genevievae]
MSSRDLSTLMECVAGCCCCVFGAVIVVIGLVAVYITSAVYDKPSEYEKKQLTGRQMGMALIGLGFVTLLSVGLYGIIKYFNRRMKRQQLRRHLQERFRLAVSPNCFGPALTSWPHKMFVATGSDAVSTSEIRII